MMAIMFLGKLLGIVRDRFQAMHFGADTAEAIAFVQASSLPRNFLDIMFAAAFSASFIPVFNSYLETKGKGAAMRLASSFVTLTFIITTVVTVVSVIFAAPLFDAFLGGSAMGAETRSLGIELLRYMFPLMVFSGLAFSLTGVLQSLGEFRVPAAMSVVSNGIILVYYFFFIERFGVYGLTAAFLIGWAAQALIQVPFLIKNKFPFRLKVDFKEEGLRRIGKLALPVMAASWVAPVNLLVNAKASVNLYGGVYGVNAIHFSHNLYMIISGVFVLSVANVVFPALSRQAVADGELFRETLCGTLRSLFLFLLPIMFGLAALSTPIIRLVYQVGRFGEAAVSVTAEALLFYSFGILGCGLQILLTRACYALQDGRTPLYSSLAAIALNAVLSFTLAPRMGVAGPALASAVSITAAALILTARLTSLRLIQWDFKLITAFARMFAAAAAVGLFAYWLSGVLLNMSGGGWAGGGEPVVAVGGQEEEVRTAGGEPLQGAAVVHRALRRGQHRDRAGRHPGERRQHVCPVGDPRWLGRGRPDLPVHLPRHHGVRAADRVRDALHRWLAGRGLRRTRPGDREQGQAAQQYGEQARDQTTHGPIEPDDPCAGEVSGPSTRPGRRVTGRRPR
ncbi:MAG: murein biosynthesis integral membrane protein MurJ [Kiritimatiellaeota bacterium]|nr:murein biosynthesis integral membrane protein MurJ [Kiritimatiellota bacterium]